MNTTPTNPVGYYFGGPSGPPHNFDPLIGGSSDPACLKLPRIVPPKPNPIVCAACGNISFADNEETKADASMLEMCGMIGRA